MATLPMKILDHRIGKEYPMPAYATPGAAAFDLVACLPEDIGGVVLYADDVDIPGATRSLIGTGIAVEIPAGYVGILSIRSSIGAKLGVSMANCVGIIDSDYRGEVKVCVENHSGRAATIHSGERIAQLTIVPVLTPEIQIVDELSDTTRGTGGFGSTGKN